MDKQAVGGLCLGLFDTAVLSLNLVMQRSSSSSSSDWSSSLSTTTALSSFLQTAVSMNVQVMVPSRTLSPLTTAVVAQQGKEMMLESGGLVEGGEAGNADAFVACTVPIHFTSK